MQSQAKENNRSTYKVKSVLVGDQSVGKSSLIQQYNQNQVDPGIQPTVGINFVSKEFSSTLANIKLQIWDTAGQEIFRALTQQYYKNTALVVLVFDLTNESSFQSLGSWLQEIKERSFPGIVITLVGNKSDLKQGRAVSKEQIEQFITNYNKIQNQSDSEHTGEEKSQSQSGNQREVLMDEERNWNEVFQIYNYWECSSFEKEGVEGMFQEGAKEVLFRVQNGVIQADEDMRQGVQLLNRGRESGLGFGSPGVQGDSNGQNKKFYGCFENKCCSL